MALDWCQIFFFHLMSWEQIDGFWWNFVYAVVWLTHTIFPNFSTLPLIDVKISIFLNIFRSNEWILINCVYALICICSLLWLIHIIFPNFSTELWHLIDFRIMFKLNICEIICGFDQIWSIHWYLYAKTCATTKLSTVAGYHVVLATLLLVTEDWFKYNA